MDRPIQLSRRAVVRGGVLSIAGAILPALGQAVSLRGTALKIGALTDVHYADKPALGTRYYRDSLAKVRAACAQFRQAGVQVLVELGDLIDAAQDAEQEIGWLRAIDAELARACDDRHYVLGNHCLATLTREEFTANTGPRRQSGYYSFDCASVRCLILDACYTTAGLPYARGNFDFRDTALPAEELAWLAAELKAADRPCVLFTHQRLDGPDDEVHTVKNASAIRRILEGSGKVLAVFQGHSHRNDYREIAGIPYCVLRAVVEGQGVASSGHAIITVTPEGGLEVQGFVEQSTHKIAPQRLSAQTQK